ncbi:MAG: hypothetical protein FWE07_03700 [Turicibacter sp.]|nr:hypothetical protein [Turicibacter sp.]
MMEAYQIALTVSEATIFVGVSAVTILFSASAPILHILKMNPKDILMKGNIG